MTAGKNARVKDIRFMLANGARPRFSPFGERIVFDRKNGDGFYDVYLSDVDGSNIRAITEGKPSINQRNNGNAVFHPSGEWIIFVSEEEEHFGDEKRWLIWLGDPGLGLFSNIWAVDRAGTKSFKLTDIPVKKHALDPTPAQAIVNPVFSMDGSQLIWTRRYDDGGQHNWGKWRIEGADFVIENNRPFLRNGRVLYTPEPGNYVTCMGMFDAQHLLVAGNLDGQHEYGMDLYRINLSTGQASNLFESPLTWEEGSAITPRGHIVYMTNRNSSVALDFNVADWTRQPVEREYWLMDLDGHNGERLTYFNDPIAPEHWGRRALPTSVDVSPDGRFLVGTLGVDKSIDPTQADVQLVIVLIELNLAL